MNRKWLLAIMATLALAAGAFWLLRSDKATPQTTTAAAPTNRPVAKGRPTVAETPASEAAGSRDAFGHDLDPVGTLVLEGQVLGEGDAPVAGALVRLASRPPKTATTGEDGSFTFDKLIAREYTLSARAGDAVGGPVPHRLTDKSQPAVIRVRAGSALAVKVVRSLDGTPVEGAEVVVHGALEQRIATSATGDARFTGLSRGWATASVEVQGFAPAHGSTMVSGKDDAAALTLRLEAGAAVAGRVLDHKGAPVEGARVTVDGLAIPASAWDGSMTEQPSASLATTDAQGAFRFATIASGTYRFRGYHADHAPGSSSMVTVDGQTPTAGVEITLPEPAMLRGQVVFTDGAGAANATVLVSPKEVSDMMSGNGGRQVVTDETGRFELRGLARKSMRVRAESADAASKIEDVDLTKGQAKDLRLVLDVGGRIAGVVVDGAGEPVPEVQVSAFLDMWKGGDMASMAMGGFSTDTTDGGGAFEIRGLAEGDYRVRAYREGGNQWGQEGTPAKVGELNLRLVLPNPGKIVGKLQLDTGGAPKMAMVQVPGQLPVRVTGGAFTVSDLNPGTVDLTFRGAEFMETVKADITVTTDKTTDVGTITLKRGRRVTGTVVDSTGQPVDGARVRLGEYLFADANRVGGEDQASMEDMMGMKSTTTNSAGEFALMGVSTKQAAVVAEHSARGRSQSAPVPSGKDDLHGVKLVVKGFGAVRGKVTHKGAPLGGAVITAATQGGAGMMTSGQSGEDGTFALEKLAAGSHRVSAMKPGFMTFSTISKDVTVAEGETVIVELDIPVGDITVNVTITPKAGAKVDTAQVFMYRGVVAMKTGKELMDAFMSGQGGNDVVGMKFWTPGATAVFTDVMPGTHSICSIPLTGNMSDPKFMQQIQENIASLLVYCKTVDVTATPKDQTFSQELPAMKPLPARE